MGGQLVVLLQVLAHGKQRRDAVTDSAAQLLRGAAADVAGAEDAGQRCPESALVVDKATRVEVHAAPEKCGVGIQADEDESCLRRERLLLAGGAVAHDNRLQFALPAP